MLLTWFLFGNNLFHVRTSFPCLHSLCLCSATHSTPLLLRIYIYKIFTYIRTKYSYTKGENGAGIELNRLNKNLSFKMRIKIFFDIFHNELFLF